MDLPVMLSVFRLIYMESKSEVIVMMTRDELDVWINELLEENQNDE